MMQKGPRQIVKEKAVWGNGNWTRLTESRVRAKQRKASCGIVSHLTEFSYGEHKTRRDCREKNTLKPFTWGKAGV